MVRFIGRSWRRHLADIVTEARHSALIVVPFVKHAEAVWLCAKLTDCANPAIKKEFARAIKRAKPAFAAVQVGTRTAHAVFGDAIQFVLRRGPQSIAYDRSAKTWELAPAAPGARATWSIHSEGDR